MDVDNTALVFVVGNSRSGTSMCMRILRNHSKIHSVNELHFFEKHWCSKDHIRVIDKKEALWLASRLLFIDQYNVLKRFSESEFSLPAQEIVEGLLETPIRRHDVYHAVLMYLTHRAGKTIACEKTPQNLFYLREILSLYPNCHVINLVRDPRAILLSQKTKWQRKASNDSYLRQHKKEVRRLRINYHPITISKLWSSAITEAEQYVNHPRVISIRFEDIVQQPSLEIQRICDFVNVSYEPEMQNVEFGGSSVVLPAGDKIYGIQRRDERSWERGLSAEEIFICQKISGHHMRRYGYDLVDTDVNHMKLFFYLLTFPCKLILALMVNLSRMRSVTEAVKKRLFSKG